MKPRRIVKFRFFDLVTIQQASLLLFFPLAIFVGSSEDKIHDEHLIGNNNRDQQNRVILRLLYKVTNEQQREVALKDNLSEQRKFIYD